MGTREDGSFGLSIQYNRFAIGRSAPRRSVSGRISHGWTNFAEAIWRIDYAGKLALIKAYWDGVERQRAISLWTMGAWGRSGFAALFGGLKAANIGWRWIFFAAVAISIIGMWMMRGTPESKASENSEYKFDWWGILTFMIMMVGYQIVATQGGNFGWTSALTLGIMAVSIVATIILVRIGKRNPNSFIDFKLFNNLTYTGATLSNFLLNATAGILIVAMTLIQLGGDLTAQEAGMLTLGYAIAIVAFIRVGETLLRKFGPRKPMLWGAIIVTLSIFLLIPPISLWTPTIHLSLSHLRSLVWDWPSTLLHPQMQRYPPYLMTRLVAVRVFIRWHRPSEHPLA